MKELEHWRMPWDLGLSQNRTKSHMLGLVACGYANLSAIACETPYEIHVIQVKKTPRHTIGLNRLWKVERPDKVDGRQTEHAKDTPSQGGRWEGKQEKRRTHFITFIAHPPSLPVRPEWSQCGERYTALSPSEGSRANWRTPVLAC